MIRHKAKADDVHQWLTFFQFYYRGEASIVELAVEKRAAIIACGEQIQESFVVALSREYDAFVYAAIVNMVIVINGKTYFSHTPTIEA